MVSADENDIGDKSFEHRYKMGELLGKGATSSAYKAFDILLQRDVVVKIIHAHLITSENAIQRFKNEASLCSSLSHPAIARIYNSGISSDGRLYIVMDFIPGKTLATVLKEQSKISFQDFFNYFDQLLAGIEHAHERNIIHRDIKPSNIIIINSEAEMKNAVLIDFGLAKSIDAESQSSTKTGLMLGSAAYMSPEQCRGDKQIDQRSDIYSLGSVMAECLLGSTPFTGGSELEIMSKHLEITEKRLVFLKRLPLSLSKIIRKCLEKDPKNRYANATELRADLADCSKGADFSIAANQTSNKVRKVIAFVALLVICGIFTYFIVRQDSPTQQISLAPERKHSYKQPINIEDLVDFVERTNQNAKNSTCDADKALAEINAWERRYGKDKSEYDRQIAEAQKVRQYCFLGRGNEAKRITEHLLTTAHFNSASQAVYPYMTYLIDTKKYDDAISLFRKFENSFSSEFSVNSERQGMFYKSVADCYFEKGEFKKAKEEYERAHEAAIGSGKDYMINNDGVGGVRGLLTTYCVLKEDREIENSIAWVNKFFSKNPPAGAAANLLLARILQERGYGERAEKLVLQTKADLQKLGRMQQVKDCDRLLADRYMALRLYSESEKFEKEYYSLAADDRDRIVSLVMLSACAFELKDRRAEREYSDKAVSLAEKILADYTAGKAKWDLYECQNSYRSAIERKIDISVEDLRYANAIEIANTAIEKYAKTHPEIQLYLYRKIHYLNGVVNRSDDNELRRIITNIESLIPIMKHRPSSLMQNFNILDALVEVSRLKEELFVRQKKYEDAAKEAKKSIEIVRGNPSGEIFFIEQTLAYCSYLTELTRVSELKAVLESNRRLWVKLKLNNLEDWTNKMKQFADLEYAVKNYDEAEQILLSGIQTLHLNQPQNHWARIKFYESLAQVYFKAGKREKYDECVAQIKDLAKKPIVAEQDVVASLEFIMRDFKHYKNRELAEICINLVEAAAPPTVAPLCPLQVSFLYTAQNEREQHIKSLKRALDLNKCPNIPMRVFYCDICLVLASAYLQNKELDEALKYINDARTQAQNIPPSPEISGRQMKLARAECSLGTYYEVKENYPESLKHLEVSLDEFEKIGQSSTPYWAECIGSAIRVAQKAKNEGAVKRLTERAKAGFPGSSVKSR